MEKFELIVKVILGQKGKGILLTKRAKSPEKDKWCLPGGKVEFNETIEEAVKRELKEELNLDFIKPIFLFYKEDFKSAPGVYCIVFYFSGSVKGKIKIKSDEISKYRFFTKEEIRKSKNIGFDHKERLMDKIKVLRI